MYRTTEMNPCYICGNKPELKSYGCGWWIECDCGQKLFPSTDHYNRGEAVAVWNYAQKTNAAVVRELEEQRDADFDECAEFCFQEAIEIVKRGGRNE